MNPIISLHYALIWVRCCLEEMWTSGTRDVTDLEGDEEVSCVMYVSCVMCVIIIVTRDIAWFRARCTVPVALPECVGGSWGWLRLRAASVSSEFRSAH